MGKSKKVPTIGYTYKMGLHMAICRACDALVEIRVGEKQAWKGNATTNTRFNIKQGKLFGGKKAEGGIDGPFVLLKGGPDQTAPADMKKKMGGLVPGFRGFVSAYFNGMYAQMNPYPKPWAFRVRRILAGWQDDKPWYSSKARILLGDTGAGNGLGAIHAMNPAHIIMYAMTNKMTGRGLDINAIDQQSFRRVADQLHSEGFGMCLAWTREESVGDFIQTILDHIGGAMFEDRKTGLIKLVLIRSDYNPNSLPVYTVDTGILEINQAEVASQPAVVNEVIVKFHNPITDEDGMVRSQSLAGFQNDGATFSVTVDYPGIPTAKLAQQVAQRELRARSVGLRRFKMTMDRRAFDIEPAGVFRLTDVSRGINNMVLRVADYDDGSPTDPTITITAVQDVFAFQLATFQDPQDSSFVPPDMRPKLARRRIFEIPYAQLVAYMEEPEFKALSFEDGFLGGVAEQPTPVHNGYEMWVQREDSPRYVGDGYGDFVPLCEFAADVDYLDTELSIKNFVDREDIFDEGMDVEEDGIEMPTAIMVDEEIMIVREIKGDTMIVSRGACDTVPQRHEANSVVWFYEELIGSDEHLYVGGEEVRVKILPWTLLGGTFPIDDAPIDNLKFNYRYFRPYAPGQVLANEYPWYRPITLEDRAFIDLRWKHRDRVRQTDKLIGHEEDNIGPEPGTTYRLRVKDENGDVLRQDDGIFGTRWQYTTQQALKDLEIEDVNEDLRRTLYIDLYSMREEFESWQGYNMVATVIQRKFAIHVAHLLRSLAVTSKATPIDGVYVASINRQLAMANRDRNIDGIYTASLMRQLTSITNFPGTPDHKIMERPYMMARRANQSTASHNVMVVAAQPLDRIPNNYDLWSVFNPNPVDKPEDIPQKPGDDLFRAVDKRDNQWARWGVADNELLFDTPYIDLSFNSSVVNLPLSEISVGTLIAVDDEIMAVTGVTDTQLLIKRGAADTIPARHSAQARVWVLQTGSEERTAVSRNYVDGGWVGIKLAPEQFADELDVEQMATSQIRMKTRVDRPYPPGRVLANGEPWYNGAKAQEGKEITITWVDRNRITQGSTAVGHDEAGIPREGTSQYRLKLEMDYTSNNKPAIADFGVFIIDGNSWSMDYATAASIGRRAAGLQRTCGGVTIRAVLHTIREDLESWQPYIIPLSLPAPACPPGISTGGGGLPNFPKWPGGPGSVPPPPQSTGSSPDEYDKLPNPNKPSDPNAPLDDNSPDIDPGQDPKPVDPNLPDDPEDMESTGSWGRDWGNNWADGEPTNGN